MRENSLNSSEMLQVIWNLKFSSTQVSIWNYKMKYQPRIQERNMIEKICIYSIICVNTMD